MNSFVDESRDEGAPPLIATKIQRPRLGPDLVSRPHLISRLNHGSHCKLTLISGHAGSGKSTLLGQWLEQNPQPSAWFSVDEHDNDLVVFASYLCAAIQSVFPEACREALDLLNAPQAPPPRVIAASLVNELIDLCERPRPKGGRDGSAESVLICLDDYHAITAPAIHELLSTMISYLPKCTHLVLTARTDPPLPLASYRARNEMFEMRPGDLQFNEVEARKMLESTTGRELSEETVDLLVEKTEGWAVGLRLAALSLREFQDDKWFAERFIGSRNPVIVDYLTGEVLSQRSPREQDFLLRTSILKRFNSNLCDEVLGFIDDSHEDNNAEKNDRSHSILQGLVKANLFLLPFDQQGRWYRYHHLFRDLLQHRLQVQFQPEYIKQLHKRASRWFERNGLIEEALEHALTAGDLDGAVQIVTRQRYKLMNQARWQRLDRYLRLFTDDFINQHPDLLMLKAWLIYHRGHYSQLPEALEQLEIAISQSSLSAEQIRFLKGEASALASLLSYYNIDREKVFAAADYSIKNTPSELWIVRTLARLVLAGAYQMKGDLNRAYGAIYSAIDEENIDSNRFKSTTLMSACYIYWLAADTEGLIQLAEQCLRQFDFPYSSQIKGHVLYHLGCVYYHKNQLEAAEMQLSEVVQQPHLNYGDIFAYSSFSLCLVYLARNQPDEAVDLAASTLGYLRETGNMTLLQIAQAFEAELALKLGKISRANQWAAQFPLPPTHMAMVNVYQPVLTLIKIWMANNTLGSRKQAAQLLGQLRNYAEANHNTFFLIEILAMESILYHAGKDESRALDTLERALALAENGGFIRLFVDYGESIAYLLKLLQQRELFVDYISRILEAFPPMRTDLLHSVQTLADPLTPRELEVLEMLAERLTNKEIAEGLVISPGTIKTHTLNIYSKLDVHSRRQAVRRGRELGFLLPE